MHTDKQLSALGVPFQVATAVDQFHPSVADCKSKQLPYIDGKGNPIRYLTTAEIGCVLSHMSIYRKMIDENIDLACILEDDNDYDLDLKDLLVYDNINVTNWELLFLGHHGCIPDKGARSRMKKKLKLNGYYIGEPVEAPRGTYAYIIRKSAAIKLYQHCFPVRMPADHYTGHASALGIKSFVLSPPCAFSNPSFDSTIHDHEEIVYLNQELFLEQCKVRIREFCKKFSWLYAAWVWIAANRYLLLIVLRKAGLIKNTYAQLK